MIPICGGLVSVGSAARFVVAHSSAAGCVDSGTVGFAGLSGSSCRVRILRARASLHHCLLLLPTVGGFASSPRGYRAIAVW
ncbi:uncharacterized protein K452DRAFT_115835 [Aplosporella prunicola CBS 121167]|uniref:Uncharacterized protein n=1 Tax=Aplosporella prunicola CBS 121167 TaxID=1176127 RepID=A0A6A6AYW5_9PEZI|nr:uncharacterized protein K452DRAFT_115835 [Aplosporella prunicola CBS 121167]KAF2136970.1 hypothetical protein K452DRAFT_115835 [Aplosporella prunicola CBS 121167]